ncbi:hypothetical protein TNCT_497141 [Trichonephila clavata]|uniref:Uncharacterized protein n=1 Tax=Trichonephila clavata TaxID=2740835 RepID=A0A8X6FUS8_TRICU|nr:hypothetical protein TNCT_497141 [Trichonephila clavata]
MVLICVEFLTVINRTSLKLLSYSCCRKCGNECRKTSNADVVISDLNLSLRHDHYYSNTLRIAARLVNGNKLSYNPSTLDADTEITKQDGIMVTIIF